MQPSGAGGVVQRVNSLPVRPSRFSIPSRAAMSAFTSSASAEQLVQLVFKGGHQQVHAALDAVLGLGNVRALHRLPEELA